MGLMDEATEQEKDGYRHFLEGPGLSILVRFLANAMKREKSELVNREASLDDIRFSQGKYEGYAIVLTHLKKSGQTLAAPDNKGDNK